MENSTSLTVACILHSLFSGLLSQKISPSIIRSDGGCYSANEIREIGRQVVLEALQSKEVPDCGEGLWKQVISLNMINVEETCPVGMDVISNPRSCYQTTAPRCSLATMRSRYYCRTWFPPLLDETLLGDMYSFCTHLLYYKLGNS